MDEPKSKKIVAIIGLLVIVAAIGVGMAVSQGNKAGAPSSSATPVAALTPTPSPAAAGAYKDGTYSASGDYDSPGGGESINISITLKDGAVADTSATQGVTNPDGKRYQSDFISGYKSQVVGKNINQVSLSRVSGSSLTPQGFNDAVAKIKSQAKS